jgi:F1F0 ATPase subunit 2
LSLALALSAGVLLGAAFFGGLWWTVRKGVSSEQPAWCSGGLLRMSIAAGFFCPAVTGERLLLCILGFVMVRPVVTWLTRPSRKNQTHPAPEASHAP